MPPTLHRRHLPHLYDNEGIYFVTFRLADSIPLNHLVEMGRERMNQNFEKFKKEFHSYDSSLHVNKSGNKYLIRKDIAGICASALHYPDGKDYKLICYSIMPNHVHLCFELLKGNRGISKILQGMKGVSARRANKLLKRSGKFWQDESFDRWARDDTELYFIIKYILMNPVEAGLVNCWFDWKHTYCRPEYIVI